MKMKKLNGLFAFIAILGLAACGTPSTGGSTNTDDIGEYNPATDDVEITFWHTMGKANKELLDTLIKSFNEKYPKIKVKESSAAGGYDDLKDLIKKNIATNTLPTMAFCYPDHVAEYIESGKGGVCLDLTPYINSDEYGFTKEEGSHKNADGVDVYGKDDYVDAFWREGASYTKSGVYSLPFAKSTEALFYNKDIFDLNGWQVPTTWEQMWNLCDTIKATYPDVTPLGYDSDSNFFITMCEQMNIPFTSATGEHYLFNNDKAKAMVSDLKAKFDKQLFITKGSSGNGTYTSTKFTAEEIIMSIGSTGGTTYNGTDNFEVGVAPVPYYDLSNPAVVSQGPSICMFNSATKAQRTAAWLFYKHLSTAENSTYYSVSTGYQPVRLSSYETETYKKFSSAQNASLFNKVAKVSSELLDSYFVSPVFVGSANARNQVGSLLTAVLNGSRTVDSAFNEAMSNCVNA